LKYSHLNIGGFSLCTEPSSGALPTNRRLFAEEGSDTSVPVIGVGGVAANAVEAVTNVSTDKARIAMDFREIPAKMYASHRMPAVKNV